MAIASPADPSFVADIDGQVEQMDRPVHLVVAPHHPLDELVADAVEHHLFGVAQLSDAQKAAGRAGNLSGMPQQIIS